jgi:hypothetical protein
VTCAVALPSGRTVEPTSQALNDRLTALESALHEREHYDAAELALITADRDAVVERIGEVGRC